METPATKQDGMPFDCDERATMRSISDSTPMLMLDDPAIHADRPISCACFCDSVGEHNHQVTLIELALYESRYMRFG